MSRDEAEKTFWVTIVTSVIFIVFGIYLLYKPSSTITIISRCISILMLCVAIFGLYKYFTRKKKEKKIDINIIYSIIAFIVAILLFFNPLIITGFVPLAIGGIMIVNSILKLGYLKQLKKNECKDFGTCILIFILMLILSILIIFNPLKSVLNTNQLMGMIIVFYAILDVIICYLFKNNIA